MRKKRSNRPPRFRLDPKLVRISPEEIRADLLYPAGRRPPGPR